MRVNPILCLAILLALPAIGVYADDPRLLIDPGGHTSIIRKIVFTRDGKYLISAGDDKVIRVWDVEAGKVVRTIQGQIGDGPEGKIYAAALSPDEKYLAVGGWLAGTSKNREPIRIHDFRTGEVIALLTGHENAIHSLAFSPDGRYLASGSADQTVRVWDMTSNPMRQAHRLPGHSDEVYDVAFSPDGKRVASASRDKTLKLWDVVSGVKIADLPKRHEDAVNSVAFSPDGRYIASGGDDRRVLLWNAKTGNFIKELYKQGSQVYGLSFSPDGKRLLTGSGVGDYTCYLLAVPSGDVITRFDKHGNIVLATAFSPNGRLAATAGGNANLVYLWNPDDGKVSKTLTGKGGPVWSVGFARDGQSVAFGTKFEFISVNQRGPLQKAINLRSADSYNVSLGGEVSNEASYLRAQTASGDYALKTTKSLDPVLQIIKSGQAYKAIARDITSGQFHRSYTFTRDGRYIASGGANGLLTLYETQTGQLVREFVGHTIEVWAVAVAPDDKTLVSGSADQTIKLWDIGSGKNLLTVFVATDDEWVAWTPQGYYTSSLNGDKYIAWHVNNGVDKAAGYYTAAQFQKQFYRPDVVAEYLKSRDIQLAVKAADEKRGIRVTAGTSAANVDLLSIIPPVVFIRAPEKDELTVNSATLMVTAEAQPAENTLPVSGIEVLLNGAPVAKTRGDFIETQVTLQPGENLLAVTASNSKATSKVREKKIIYTGKANELPNLRLLAIGIANYKNPATRKLEFADRDAEEIEKAYKAQEGVLFNRVETRVLPNEKATRAAIIRALGWLKSEVNQGDYRILFLSGHGGVDGKGDYYFYTYEHDPGEDPEINDVRGSTLWDALDVLRGARTILYVDTCRAAAIARKQDGGLIQELKRAKNLNQGLVLYAASANDEPSQESPQCRQGIFTCALLEGLNGAANTDGNGWINADELGGWVTRRVREMSGGKQQGVFDPPSSFKPFPIFMPAKSR